VTLEHEIRCVASHAMAEAMEHDDLNTLSARCLEYLLTREPNDYGSPLEKALLLAAYRAAGEVCEKLMARDDFRGKLEDIIGHAMDDALAEEKASRLRNRVAVVVQNIVGEAIEDAT